MFFYRNGCLATQCVTAFRMDVQEVSQQEFLQIMGTNLSQNQECGLNCPVENVQENQAQEYCHKVGKRLPTALDWQYAAKSGQVEGHPWGREIGDYVWFSENSQGQVHPVGENLPNAWGLVDMAGNVAEWTSTPASGPNSALRIVMGGHANSTQDDLAESLLLKQTYLRAPLLIRLR